MQVLQVPDACPKCGGKVWDNRATKRNPKAPDFKCRDRSCDGVHWAPKPGQMWADSPNAGQQPAPAPRSAAPSPAREPMSYGHAPALDGHSVGGVATVAHSGHDHVLSAYLGCIADAAGPVAQTLAVHHYQPTTADILAAARDLFIYRSKAA